MSNESALIKIHTAVQSGLVDYADYTLARFVDDKLPNCGDIDLWLLVLVNVQLRAGHVCLDHDAIPAVAKNAGWMDCPSSVPEKNVLSRSPIIGGIEQDKILVYDLQRFYLQRFFRYENQLAEKMISLSKFNQSLSPDILQKVEGLFELSSPSYENWQKTAALVSCQRKLCLISGGPGTGKTWTVCRILAALFYADPVLNISLAAPTGKAAARLNDSINKLLQNLPVEEKIKKLIPQEAQTLHRLLGINRYSHQPKYNHQTKLSCDVLIVDEASMVDLQTMDQISQALDKNARLILLGDKNQLASVEAGSVFADLCSGFKQSEHSVELQHSYRFTEGSSIGLAAEAVNTANEHGLIQALNSGKDVVWQQGQLSDFQSMLLQQIKSNYQPLLSATSIEQAFEIFYHFQILVSGRHGDYGAESINDQIDQDFLRRGLIDQSGFYAGKPLMMRSNDYFNQVFNGDIGIIWPDVKGQLMLWFEVSDGNYKILSLAQVNSSETAYAMTVHKSQGSEFNTVWLVLPQIESPVCSREWLYTGITRVVKNLHVWGSEKSLVSALKRKTERASGLAERLLQNL